MTKLVVTRSVYGLAKSHLDDDHFRIILKPATIDKDKRDEYQLFWVGKRLEDDEGIFYSTKHSPATIDRTNHTLEFQVDIQYFITYAGISVNVRRIDRFDERLSIRFLSNFFLFILISLYFHEISMLTYRHIGNQFDPIRHTGTNPSNSPRRPV